MLGSGPNSELGRFGEQSSNRQDENCSGGFQKHPRRIPFRHGSELVVYGYFESFSRSAMRQVGKLPASFKLQAHHLAKLPSTTFWKPSGHEPGLRGSCTASTGASARMRAAGTRRFFEPSAMPFSRLNGDAGHAMRVNPIMCSCPQLSPSSTLPWPLRKVALGPQH